MNALNSINETNQVVKGGQKVRGKYSYIKEPKEANTSTQSEYEEEDPIAFPAGPSTTSTKKHEEVKKTKNAGKGTLLGQKRQAGNSLVITNKTSGAAPPIGNMIGPPYPVYMQD